MARPNVLLIHGMCCDSSFWEPQVAALSDAGYRVASPDLPWHGGPTAGVTPSLQGLSEWVAALADVWPAVIVGHSLGGMIGLDVALRWPERVAGLALIDSFPSLALNARLLPGMFVKDQASDVRAWIESEREAILARMTQPVYDTIWPSVCEFDLTDWLAEIACPVLGVYGGRGVMDESHGERLRAELMLDRVTGPVTVRIVPGAGHFVNLEQPDAVTRMLLDWLEGLTTKGGATQ